MHPATSVNKEVCIGMTQPFLTIYKRSNVAQQFSRCVFTHTCTCGNPFVVVEQMNEFLLIPSHSQSSLSPKPLGSRQLVVVPVLSKIGPAWHDDYRLFVAQCGQYGAHSGVRNDESRLSEKHIDFTWIQKIRKLYILWRIAAWPNLTKNLGPDATCSPIVNGRDETIKRQLGSNSQEDHNTAPQ